MENASKALVIAGAILIAILLISLGMLVLNKATGILNSEQLDDAERTTINQKFTKFEGTVKGTEVRSLISEIVSFNASEKANKNQFIKINGTAKVVLANYGDNPTGTQNIKNSSNYTVTISEYANGIVSQVTIDN